MDCVHLNRMVVLSCPRKSHAKSGQRYGDGGCTGARCCPDQNWCLGSSGEDHGVSTSRQNCRLYKPLVSHCENTTTAPTPQSEIILYQTEDGQTHIECRFENETIWLTQKLMAELFQVTVPTVNEHLKGIFEDGEVESKEIAKFPGTIMYELARIAYVFERRRYYESAAN